VLGSLFEWFLIIIICVKLAFYLPMKSQLYVRFEETRGLTLAALRGHMAVRYP